MALILALWVVLYALSNPATHLGAFFGNAIADWSGSLVIIIVTSFLYERGSAESKPPPRRRNFPGGYITAHSLSIFLIVTGIGWAVLYATMNPNAKWGQVVGNVTSEWLQMLGLVILTKRFFERGSKGSKKTRL